MRGITACAILVPLAVASLASVAQGTLRPVPDPYPEIDAAMSAATSGSDTVTVSDVALDHGGRYLPFLLNKSVPVINTSGQEIVIDAADTASYAVGITASGARVEGFTIRGGDDYGVYMTGGRLQDCTVELGSGSFNHGVYAGGTCTIDHCSVDIQDASTSYTGIRQESGSPTITHTTVDVAQGTGISVGNLGSSTEGELSDCEVTVGKGIGMSAASGTLTIQDNVITLTDANADNNVGLALGAYGDELTTTVQDCLIKGVQDGVGVGLTDDTPVLQRVTIDGFRIGVQDWYPTIKNEVWQCIASNQYVNGAGFYNVKTYFCIADSSSGLPYYFTSDSLSVTEDPLYCDRSNGEYTLRVDSYGNPENNDSGGRIGAFGVACMYGTLARDSEYAGNGSLAFPGDLIIPVGRGLTLGAGTTVNVAANSDRESGGTLSTDTEMLVNGTLTLNGASGSEITFQSDATSPDDDDWVGILGVGDSCYVDASHVTVKDGWYGIYLSHPGGTIKGASITDCTTSHNHSTGITVKAGTVSQSLTIQDNTVGAVGITGIWLDVPSATVSRNTVQCDSSGADGFYLASGSITLEDNTISGGSNGYGVEIYSGNATLDGNSISDAKYGVYMRGGSIDVGLASDSNSGNTIAGNTRGVESLCVGAGTCPTCSGFSASLRYNLITSNYNGLVTEKRASKVDAGTSSDHGHNFVYGNTQYCVWNRSACDTLMAVGNYLGECADPPLPPLPSVCWAGDVNVSSPSCTGPSAFGAGINEVTGGRPVRLLGATPNPLTQSTQIRFEIQGNPVDVGLQIYDVAGRQVRAVEAGQLAAGPHLIRWDGRNDRGSPVGAGVYFMRVITSRGDHDTIKALVLR